MARYSFQMLYSLCLMLGFQGTVFIQYAYGDGPLQSLLSTFECYGTCQEGCGDKYFTDPCFHLPPSLTTAARGKNPANTRFYLFTKGNEEKPEMLHYCNLTLPEKTNFNPKCKTFIVIPGFVSGACHSAIYRELMYQRLKCPKHGCCYNYIHVEWTWGNSFDLITAVENMEVVARQVAHVIDYLKEKYGLGPEDFILMGHSLGAHICGFVGQITVIYVIHAIEPAGVIVTEKTPLDKRLDSTDAKCVLATHCNAGQCLPLYFGVNFTIGTKDIWYNNGKRQLGCVKEILKSFIKEDILLGLVSLLPAACNHFQCLQYYKQSMCADPCDLVGAECKSYADIKHDRCMKDCGSNGEYCTNTGPDSCEFDCGKHKNYRVEASVHCPYYHGVKRLKNADKVVGANCSKREGFSLSSILPFSLISSIV